MTTKTETITQTRPEQAIKPDSELTPMEKLCWGMFWGFFIGGGWLLADWVRPLIYGA